MKNEEVIKSFLNKERAVNSTGSLSSTGNCLYSYSTCIAEYDNKGNLYINLTKYSVTTSKQQYLLKRYINNNIFYIRYVYNIEYNKTHIIPENERV